MKVPDEVDIQFYTRDLEQTSNYTRVSPQRPAAPHQPSVLSLASAAASGFAAQTPLANDSGYAYAAFHHIFLYKEQSASQCGLPLFLSRLLTELDALIALVIIRTTTSATY